MNFLFVCGGTAGHINPALAVAGRLRELMPDARFLFIGVNDKMEMNLVPREGFEIRGLDMTYIKRGHDLEALTHNLDTMKNVLRSQREAKRIIREFHPDAVIGSVRAAMSAFPCSRPRTSCTSRRSSTRATPCRD